MGPPLELVWPFPKCHRLMDWGGCRCHLGWLWVLCPSRICVISHEGPGQVAGGHRLECSPFYWFYTVRWQWDLL